jgi:hypothetical protein
MATSKKKRLLDAYRIAGLRPLEPIKGVFGDPHARVVTLVRRSKKRFAGRVVAHIKAGTTGARDEYAICPAGHTVSFWSSRSGGFVANAAGP